MRLNSLCEVALNDQGRAIAPWLNDTTVGPYQRLIDAPSDTWQLVTRTDGVVTPVPGFKGGCHESCAGNNQWMRQLIGAEVPLAGSANWTPKNGYCGDIDGELALTMDAEQTTITVFRNGLQIGQFPRINPFMGIRLKGEIATWFEFDRLVNISARHVVSGEVVTVQALPGPQYSPIVFTSAIGERWVLYQTDAMGGVCHRINDKTQGYTFGTPQGIYDPDVIIKADGACVIGWATDAGQYAPRTLTIPVLGEGMVPLKVPEPPSPELPIGPIGNGDPMPDGTEIDLNDYLMPDPQHFPAGDRDPRDTHGMHLWHLPNLDKPGHRFIWCAKFGKLGNGAVGEGLYLPEDPKGHIHFAIDASWAPEPGVVQRVETWNNTIWMPRTMRIGRKYGYIQDNDTLERRRRADCAIFDRVGWSEEIWIEKVWRKFHVGGGVIKSVVFLVSNNTGVREGQTTSDPGLYVETRHLVPGGYAWRQWTSYQAKKLFATGSADFSITPSATSKFWYPGGAVYPAKPPSCIPAPTPAPAPIPPIPPTPTPMPTDTLLPGQNILVDRPLVSQDRRFRLLYQRDGNLVQYGPNGPMWATGTNGQSVGFVSLQGDGNFVIYDGAIKPVWSSSTYGKPVQRLLVQNDGNTVLYSSTAAVWSTGTVYVPPPIPPGPQPLPVVPVKVEGKYLRRPDGAIHSVRSASSFLMLRRLLEESDEIGVRTDMQKWARLGYNELRVFSRVDWNGTPGPGLFPERYPNYWDKFHRLFTLAAENGLYVEIVALTGCIPNRDNPDYGAMASWVNRVEFERRQHINTFLEVCNEPPVNGVDIEALMARLDTSSWSQPWSTGQYFPTAMPAGSYCSVHTDRVDGWDWVRKAGKDLLEYRDGGGPNEPTDPEMARPIIGDEPMGAASFYSPGRRDNVPIHHYTAGALSTLFGAGYCCHHESGLRSEFPTGLELECVIAAAEGMKAINPIYQTGQYSRVGLPEFPIVEDPSVRTYGMFLNGVWQVVRVGPTTTFPSLASGWKIVNSDTYGVVMQVVPA